MRALGDSAVLQSLSVQDRSGIKARGKCIPQDLYLKN